MPDSANEKQPLRIGFRTLLVSVVLSLVLLVGAVDVVLSHRAAQGAAHKLALQVLDQQAERVQAEIRAVLGEASLQGLWHARLLGGGLLPSDDCRKLAPMFHEALALSPRLSYLSFAFERDGSYCHAVRGSKGNLSIRYLDRGPDGHLTLTDYTRKDGAWVQLDRKANMDDRDPRPRPYYKAALQAGKPTWTESYLFLAAYEDLSVPGITFAAPVSTADGKLVGVFSADFDLYALSGFLARLALADQAGAFVVEQRKNGERRVIAHPEPHWLSEVTPGGSAEFVAPARIKDSRVRAVMQHLGASLPDPKQPLQFEFDDKRGLHFAQVRRIGVEHGPDWLLCLTVPADELLRDANQSLREQLMVGLLCALAAIALAWALGTAVTRPVKKLAELSAAIGNLDLEAPAAGHSPVRELHQLGGAFEGMRASLRSFRKYVPAEVVRAVLKSGAEARPGGRREVLTVFFADVAGFTTIAESLPPEALVEWMGEYLSAMTAIVMNEDGTVDKFIGDCVMAFWGAPNPYPDHAYAACVAALRCQTKMAELQKGWRERGMPDVHCRIGINTGAVVVGNIGSNDRLEYTALGDAVNLASRLEGANKVYGTRILIGDTTRNIIASRVVARPVDRLAVKGKVAAVTVHELLALKHGSDATLRQVADLHTQAFEAYLAAEFAAAEALCGQVLALRPGDEPAEVLRQRCVAYRVQPPPAGWDGVFRLGSK